MWSVFKGEVILKNILFSIGLCSDAYEPISFKLGMMIDAAKLYFLKSVWMILSVSQGHRVTRNLNLCNHSVVKWPEGARIFAMVSYVWDMIARNWHKYGWFEHLLCLFVCFFICCGGGRVLLIFFLVKIARSTVVHIWLLQLFFFFGLSPHFTCHLYAYWPVLIILFSDLF